MATVRGMTPEAIRALLKREIGDYQALSIAVNSAKGASDSAVAEVENIRKDLENMDFDFDTSQLDKAMEKFETDMTELNQNLDELKDEALARENKLTALEKALNKDRSEFNKEMQKMAKELSDSKEKLQQDLSEVSEKLAQNVSEVGTNLSGELEKANKTLRESLDKDLKKLDNDLSSTFDNNLRSLERRHGQMINSLGDSMGAYLRNTESAVSGLASDLEKAKAYAEGFLQPGNLVWNPMALDDARGITPNNTNVTIESSPSGGKDGVGALKINRTSTGSSYIYYGQPQGLEFELRPGDVVAVSAWIKSTVEVPVETLGFHVSFGSRVVYNTTKIPANAWAYISGDIPYAQRAPKTVGFRVVIDKDFPANGSVIISDPHAKRKVTSDLIVDGAVVSDKIATNAVEARNIVSGAVTAGKIAADAVTANNILAGSIGAKHIVSKSIGADQLAANSVTSDKIVSNAVDADKIKAKSIGTDHLVANAVTTEKLASKAVKADNIDANAVTAQKIASKAINGDHIQANSIDTTKLTIMPGNLFPDPHFQDSCWGDSGQVYAHKNNGGELRFYPINAQHGRYYQPSGARDESMMLEKNSAYRITANIWGNNNITKGMRINVYMRYTQTSGSKGVRLIGSIPVTVGVSVESETLTTPDNMRDSECTIGFFVDKPWDGGEVSMWDVHMTRAADSSLIVKGGVQADHITSGAITTDHMSANSIDGDRIKSNTLDADKIRAKSLTSDHVTFKKGFIDNAMIGDAQITSGKIKDLDAGKITTGTMHGDRIRSNTLDANRIKTGTLDAKQIATGTLNADRIGADSITVKELRAGTIVPIGGSLIPSEPKVSGGVPEPIWWKVCDTELAANYRGWPRPEGNPWRTHSQAQGKQQTVAPPQRLVKIKPGQKYRLTFWCRSTKPDTTLFIEMRDQNGSHAVKSGAVYGSVNSGKYLTKNKSDEDWPVTDFSESKTGSYLVANFTMPTIATKVTSTIEFKEDVEYVSLRNFYFNHSNGSNQANQWISGLSLELEIPDQQAIDARQDDAIERMDKDATFLNGVMMNIARMLVRAEQNKADSTLLTTNFEGTLLYGMLGIRTSSNGQVDLYISPEWKGRIEFIANCSVGAFNGTPATWFSKVTDDDFTTHTTSSVRVAPPTPFKHNGKFKYTRVDVRPRREGVLDQLSVAIYHVPSYYEMFQLLTTKEITRVGMLEYGRTTDDPEPRLKEAPSWERRGSGLSSRR